MKKLLMISLTAILMTSAYANRGRNAELMKTSKMIDYIRKIEERKSTGVGRKEYSPKIHDFLHRKSLKMRIEIAELQRFVKDNSADPQMYEAIKELFVMSSDPAINAGKRVIIERLFGLTAKIDQLPNKAIKITATQILEASKEWSIKELVELEKILSEVVSSKTTPAGEKLLEIIDPVLRSQAERKCM